MQGLLWVAAGIVIITVVVGLIAQVLNKINEMNAQPANRPPAPRRREADPNRSSPERDMDRFLAEIDRLRKRNAEATGEATAQPLSAQKPVTPSPAAVSTRVARPVAPPPPRSRSRVVAEVAEPPPKSRRVDGSGFSSPHASPPPPTPLSPPQPTRVEDLPVATVVTPTSSTGAPSTRVTHLVGRARAAPKTDLAKNLTGLLNSGQGVAMAIILQEILGPPKSKPRG